MEQLKNKMIIMRMMSNDLTFEEAGSKLIQFSYLQSSYLYGVTESKFFRIFCLLRLGNFLMMKSYKFFE
jgi:hypothetical protein